MSMSRHRRPALRHVAAISLALAVPGLAACGTRLDRPQLLADEGSAFTTVTEPASAAPVAPGAVAPSATTTGARVPTTASAAAAPATTPTAAALGGGAPVINVPTAATTTSPGSAGGSSGSARGTSSGGKATKPSAATSSAPSGASAPCTGQGAPLVVGQTGSFSGLVGAAVGGSRTGLAVWAKDVNARGGIACHPVVLYQEDDGSDPSKAAANAQDLAQSKHVVAYVGIFDPIVISGFRSVDDQNNLPTVGGDGVTTDWNQDPNLYPVGGSTIATYLGGVKYAVDQGNKKVAYFYCVEASACAQGHDAAGGPNGFMAKAGADYIYQTSISITQSDYTAECQNAKNAGAQAILVSADGASLTRVARSCAGLSYRPTIVGQSIEFSISQANDANLQADHFTLASAVVPWMQSDVPAAAAFTAAMRTYAPGVAADGSTAQAYQSGRMLEAAIGKLGDTVRNGPITSAMIRQGLGMIKDETLGGAIAPTTYTPGQVHPPIPCYFTVTLQGSQFVAPYGSKVSCAS